ncbi:MurT ligase domain-containing protein [Herbiconiux sp. CPCC 203407]|uniref:Lipid II isoglutaminyl synthase (glutamine-hydrolyzing) subunit MurT n=1 Tax=Herbiconiux oxytropis TaxID=2970915 RepID=A0AA41XHS0_9MICO|nr:MurT ligase domain-containing protein [Herbiconiux oxytropis]MCS5720482.1 MurT ligase domain-containing protein [Herbiconiux oxytropis]MCS5726055.1 MurT ligase domain-containing protein [Herbiconiux oxytropis]
MALRTTAAVLVGRAVRVAARLRGGGSAIPGNIALRIDPGFLERTIARIPHGVVAVSGSNGKSTTTNMLAAIIRAHGLSVFTNPSGGNLPQGIASALLSEVSAGGRLNKDIAILEIDEGYGTRLAELLKPRTVLLLNIQIDQLNRYHEPDRVATMLGRVATASTDGLILNREDNFLVDMDARIPGRSGRRVSFFGGVPSLVDDASHGVASADRFDEGSAVPGSRAAAVEVVALDGARATLAIDPWTADGETGDSDAAGDAPSRTEIEVRLPARGMHYALDAAGAAATARSVLGERFRPELVTRALDTLETVYGRGEMLEVAGEQIEIIMMKNPASLQLNLDSLEGAPEQVFLAVDEGTPDPSWIYDIDFSALDHVDGITGSKAWQFAVRFGYLGIPVGEVDLDVRRALKAFLARPKPATGHKVMILNYEQMMLIRKILGFKELEGGGAA